MTALLMALFISYISRLTLRFTLHIRREWLYGFVDGPFHILHLSSHFTIYLAYKKRMAILHIE